MPGVPAVEPKKTRCSFSAGVRCTGTFALFLGFELENIKPILEDVAFFFAEIKEFLPH